MRQGWWTSGLTFLLLKKVTIQLFKDISYTSNKETYEPNPKPVFFFFYVSLYCVSNLLVEMHKYYQAELPFSYLQLSTMCALFKFKMNYLKTHAHSGILLDDWVISLPSKESKDSFRPVQGAVWSQDQAWAFCLLYAAAHIRPLPTVLLQFDPGMDSSEPLCPKWQTSTEYHSRNKLGLPWPREPACFMGRSSQFPCALVSAPALKADTFFRLSMHLFLCLRGGTHTYTHTPVSQGWLWWRTCLPI